MQNKYFVDMKKYFPEIKLGVFLIVAVIIFFVAITAIKDVPFFGNYLLKVKFNFAEGLKASSPVRFCGVNVGEIKKVEVENGDGVPIVYVHAKIAKEVSIPQGSSFFINSLSVFGEKYLEILPPHVKATSYIEKGATVEGIDPPPLFDVMSGIYKAVQKFEALLEDGDMQNTLGEVIGNFNELTTELKGLILDIKNERGTVGKLFYNDSLYIKSEEFLDDLKNNPWKLLYKPKAKKRK